MFVKFHPSAIATAAFAFLLPFWALSFEMITFQPLIFSFITLHGLFQQVTGLADTIDLAAETNLLNRSFSRVEISKISGSGGAIALNVKDGK